MQLDPKVEMCANRFELISRWGQPVDKEWARSMFELWLAQRDDAPQSYDAAKQTLGQT
jgi:hypothetical protein